MDAGTPRLRALARLPGRRRRRGSPRRRGTRGAVAAGTRARAGRRAPWPAPARRCAICGPSRSRQRPTLYHPERSPRAPELRHAARPGCVSAPVEAPVLSLVLTGVLLAAPVAIPIPAGEGGIG